MAQDTIAQVPITQEHIPVRSPSEFETETPPGISPSTANTDRRNSTIGEPPGASDAESRRCGPQLLRRHFKSWKPFNGIRNDITSRAPYYVRDWIDAWNYSIFPGIAFSLDLIETTAQYGVIEVLMSTFMSAFIFSVFGAQPLCIAGVTGPITVFNKTIHTIITRQPDSPNYLHFVGWVYLWTCNFLKFVTLFSCDTFGFYVSWVYLQYGVQVITRQFIIASPTSTQEGPYASIVLALLTLVTAHLFVRRFFSDYGMPITVVASSAMAYWGRFNQANPTTLPTQGAFAPANNRNWIVKFWELDGKWVGIAFPFGIILTVLFLFDHNVSSLMAQSSQFPLRKPPGFHWDFFLLGVTTFIAGLLGVPAPNGLIPQAPIHTESLIVLGFPEKRSEDEETVGKEMGPRALRVGGDRKMEVPIAVVEQRVSNLAQGSLCLILMSSPFLHVLGLIPRGVLAGLFWYMEPVEPLLLVRKSRIVLFVGLELIGFGATMAITQTIAAIGFPIIILLLIPLRVLVIPRLPFTPQELGILDGPTASPFTMASVGGPSRAATPPPIEDFPSGICNKL
ncbi:uncharacterized protein EI90DRAFT_3091705 [Cantharellus anzutake]|uniref:uncharacterized protein n=1 Tax=Cantharellus anzutake TaxID=1750568 RepID=UPI0019059EEF|nr:uncharacterized protein EI90DRAFT_3091705 [Cantharellus anzutake]KAF8313524.1 hypothetical protein EI90DRAFT_3091705 [Cantharellus anzutake]